VQIQGASKNKAETYLLYVEHLFVRSNAVDAPYIFKRALSKKNFRKLLQRDGIDARSVQKTPAVVSLIRRGLFFVKRQRRYAVYLQKV